MKPHKNTFSLRTVLLHKSLWPGLLSTSHHFIVVQTISDGNTGGSLNKHVDLGDVSYSDFLPNLISFVIYDFIERPWKTKEQRM